MTRDLTIAAYLGVKDEAEIIEQSIRHLRSIGVDRIIVCDMSSTDGTLEILDKLRSDDLSVFCLTNAALADASEEEDRWESQARRKYAIAPCDWVIFLDADDFWLPASGNLKTCKAFHSADVLVVDRFHIVLGPTAPRMPPELTPETYDRIDLYARTVPNFHIAKQAHSRSTPWIRGDPLPKIAARRSKIGEIAKGQHDVTAARDCRRERPDDLLIAHLTLSTQSRFERKVANIRAIYAESGIDLSQPGESWENYGTAWHWRRWATLPDLGKEFDDNAVSDAEVAALRETGDVMSAQALLDRRVPRLDDAHLRGNRVLIELEYDATFRPRDLLGAGDGRLLAVRFVEFTFSRAGTEKGLGKFDFRVPAADGWREIYGVSHSEPGGRWSEGPRSAIVFLLAEAAPERLRIEITHQINQQQLPRVPARIRVNGGPWHPLLFEDKVCAIEVDLTEGRARLSQGNLSLVGGSAAPTLSIIVVNYQQALLTFAAILAIQAAGIRVPYEIIVVDNGSAPSATMSLARMELPVRLIETPRRVSFGTANNIGAEAARGEVLLLLNNDAFLAEGVVERLLGALSGEGVGLVGPVLRFPDDALQEMGRFVSADGLTTGPIFNGLGWDAPELADVDYISAACMMLRRADFLSVGGFDPEFEFAYSEDCDLCLRLRAVGKHTRLVTSALVRHILGATASHEDSDKLEAFKRRNINLMRSRWQGLRAPVTHGAPVDYAFDIVRLERQIAGFPDEPLLNAVIWDGPLTSGSHADAMLAHAAAFSCLRPTLVAGPVAYPVLDIRDRASALGLDGGSLATGGRAELETRELDVVLASGSAFPPATTPRWGRRRILHCPVAAPVDESDMSALSRRVGNLLNFDTVVTDSEFGRRACAALLDRLGAPPIDIEVIAGPVDVFTPEERARVRGDIIVSMGPLRPGASGGAHEAALRAFYRFSATQDGRRWRMVIVGPLSPDDDPVYVDVLRGHQPQLDVDVLVSPPRSVLRRLLLRSKVWLSARGLDAESTVDSDAFTHSLTQVGTAISAGCVPVVFHVGAEAEFCAAHGVGYAFRNERELADKLGEAAGLADGGGLATDRCEAMESLSPTAHSQAWARVVSQLGPMEARDTREAAALVVTGCHRSGTSAMARALSLAGADLPSDLMAPAADNPSGFWEPTAIVEFNDGLLAAKGSSWDDPYAFFDHHPKRLDEADIEKACRLLEANYPRDRPIVVKDPRISILTGVWEAALQAAQYRPTFVVMVREPREVAASLTGRNGFSTGKGLLLWARYMLAVERDTRSAHRVFIAYEDLLSQPMATLDRIASALDVTLPRKAGLEARVAAFITTARRHKAVKGDWNDRWTEPVGDYFQALLAACRGEPVAESAGKRLEVWFADFTALFRPPSVHV